jgi:hypothetical protein
MGGSGKCEKSASKYWGLCVTTKKAAPIQRKGCCYGEKIYNYNRAMSHDMAKKVFFIYDSAKGSTFCGSMMKVSDIRGLGLGIVFFCSVHFI